MYRQMAAGCGAEAFAALKQGVTAGTLSSAVSVAGLGSRLTVKPNLLFRTGRSMTHSVFPPPI
jgi:hypothetical protein